MLSTDHTIQSAIRGRLVTAGDPDWDQARQAYNLLVDQRPEAVAFPVDERDVAAVIRYARERDLRVAPQATGHNAAPLGPLDGAILLNTSELQGVSIDAAAARVRVAAGTKWERVVEPLSGLGLAALHGSSPDVSVVGYSLGGGLGWLGRRYGLQANSVTAIELVTADGDLIRTDAVHEPDLFWALRGGGGNFGVVTAIEFQVYPVRDLYAGAMFFPYERAGEVIETWAAIEGSLPDEMTSWASILHIPDVPFVPEPMRGASFAVVLAAHLGTEAEGRALLEPVKALGPVMDTFATVPPVALADLAMDPPDPIPGRSTHLNLGAIDSETIQQVANLVDRESGIVAFQLRQLGGAIARTPHGAGARATLEGKFAMFAVGIAGDPAATAALERSLTEVRAVLEPHQASEYPNFVEDPADASRFFDELSWRRLRQVKALYDPEDVIRGNHHVPPAR